MDTRCLTRPVREQTGLFLFRFDERRFSGLLFQEPLRITRWPSLGPLPFQTQPGRRSPGEDHPCLHVGHGEEVKRCQQLS